MNRFSSEVCLMDIQSNYNEMARHSSYYSYNGNAMVEDFPSQHVRQDYGRKRSTMSKHTDVTGSDAELWRKCNVLLKSHKKLTRLFVVDSCIHLIVLIFVTITVSQQGEFLMICLVIRSGISCSFKNIIFQICMLCVALATKS